MRKMLNLSLFYFILAMVCGVFYREFTKFNGYEGRTALAFAHVHFMMLGMMLFLILALFAKAGGLTEQRSFRIFLVLYNIGLPLMAVMLIIRGITQVLGIELAKGADASISGVAGISHIVLAVALASLFAALKSALPGWERQQEEK
ncbi:DUF2871 domain-containing protein [Eisenbergiella sp.]